jgi:hypothetical protein
MLTIPAHKGNANQMHTKIPPHLFRIEHREHHQQLILARMQGKMNLHTLLVGK